MLKHCITQHENKSMSKIKFGMKVLQYSKSSFERQIRESVQIQYERKEHHILNSRSEYNSCSLPRICTQVGEGQYENYNKELEAEKREDEKIEAKIRALRKEQSQATPNQRRWTKFEKKEN